MNHLPSLTLCACIAISGILSPPQMAFADSGPALTAQVSPKASEAQVDLNRADKETLQSLSGIGQKRAQLIVAYREEHGPFKNLTDLLNIKGIRQGLLDRIRSQVVLG